MASTRWLLLVAAATFAAGAPAQKSAEKPPAIAVLGASVSGGFVNILTEGGTERNRSIRLSAACRSVWPRERAQIRDYSEVMMFRSPLELGERKIERALRAKPELVIAVDFMFWFGYGYVDRGGGAGAEAKRRLELQRQGFALLEKFECPIIVGDYPDMRGADPRMLSPRQVPSPEMLAALNGRLNEWADARPNVRVFGLADWVARVKKDEVEVVVGERVVALPSDLLLQSDRLHATSLGIALLASGLVPVVERSLPADHALRKELPDASRIFEQLGVDVDLPEPAAAKAGNNGADK